MKENLKARKLKENILLFSEAQEEQDNSSYHLSQRNLWKAPHRYMYRDTFIHEKSAQNIKTVSWQPILNWMELVWSIGVTQRCTLTAEGLGKVSL